MSVDRRRREGRCSSYTTASIPFAPRRCGLHWLKRTRCRQVVQSAEGVWIRRTLGWVRRRLPPRERAGSERHQRCAARRNPRSPCRSGAQGTTRHRDHQRRYQHRWSADATAIEIPGDGIKPPFFRYGGRGDRHSEMVQCRERLWLHRPRWRRRGCVRSRLSPRKIWAHRSRPRATRHCRCGRGPERA